MSFHTISEELRLGTDQQSWLRSFSFAQPASAEAPNEEVFALVELPDRTPNREQVVQAIFATLRELCFIDQTLDAYERFETALKEVNAVIAEAREQLPNKNLGRINAVIGLLSGRELHLTQTGEAEAYLVRQGTLTTISEGLSAADLAVDTFVNIASGRVENHDKILLASERLLRYATKTELTKIFSPHKEIGLALEELDEIIVLEGAQTTGILGISIVTPTVYSRAVASDAQPSQLPFELPEFLAGAGKQVQRAVAWMRDQIPTQAQLPGTTGFNLDKNYVVLGFLVVVILVILSLSWQLGSERSGIREEEVKTMLASIQENIDIAKLRRNIGDKIEATARLTEAEGFANDLVKAGVALEEAGVKISEIKALRDELDNIRRYTDLKPAIDLTKTKKDISLLGIADFHSRRVVYDSARLYETALDGVDLTNDIDATGKIRAADYFADRDAMAFLTSDGKLIEWRDGTANIMDTADETWKSGVDLATYSSFVYLLDPTNNQIWKYSRKNDNYGNASEYSQNTDLTKAVSLAIDGDLWVLNNDNDGDMKNDIVRIRKGEKRPLVIQDLPESVWNAPKKILTSENLKYVYVLDQANSRILRFYKDPPDAGVESKQLIYNTQYLFEGLSDLRDFWVDTSEQKIWVIDQKGIYEVAI